MPDRSERLPWIWPRAAYLHIPFCAHRCGYCDFAVSTGQDHLIDLYIEAVGEEMARLGSPEPVDTIFLGGGTPTYLAPARLARLLSLINRWLPLSAQGEYSIEATPESVSSDTVQVLTEFGVNRVSLGVQSFNPELLRQLDRVHSANEIGPALDRIRKRIDNVSLDLIFGVPDQAVHDWMNDIESALTLAPAHVSTYGLTYEKGTALWKRRQHGEVHAVSEGDELAMYLHAIDRLSRAGLTQYEVSNFAAPGRRCRHNEVYWANEAYFGFGVGAARYVNRRRKLNCRNTSDYMRKVLSGEDPTIQSEELPPEESARETIAIQLRRSSGVIRESFQVQTGFRLDELAGGSFSVYLDEGLIEDDGTAVRMTTRGRCVADSLAVELAWGQPRQFGGGSNGNR